MESQKSIETILNPHTYDMQLDDLIQHLEVLALMIYKFLEHVYIGDEMDNQWVNS
jgi:hypothetical protein